MRHCSPIDHQCEIVEVAYAEVVACAYREYRYGNAGAAPGSQRIAQSHSGKHCGGVACGLCPEGAVVAQFPSHEFAGIFVENHELVFGGNAESGCRYIDAPHREVVCGHSYCLCRIPFA